MKPTAEFILGIVCALVGVVSIYYYAIGVITTFPIGALLLPLAVFWFAGGITGHGSL